MIRSRKDEGTSTITSSVTGITQTTPMIVGGLNKHENTTVLNNNHNNTSVVTTLLPSPTTAFRFQRTSSNIGTATSKTNTSTTTTTTTPTIKRNHSSFASIGMNKEDSSSSTTTTAGGSGAPSATAVSSFANTASSSMSSSLQYYNNLLQHQMYNIRKSRTKKKWKHHNNNGNEASTTSSIWTVQMPKRMLFGTMGIFLLIPVVLFVYKEFHLPHLDEKELRGQRPNDLSSDGKYIVKKSNRNQEYVTWMANFLASEELDEEDEGDELQLDSTALDAINETIRNENYDNNITGMTGSVLDDLFVKNKMKEEEDGMKKGTNTINDDDVDESEEALDVFENEANNAQR